MPSRKDLGQDGNPWNKIYNDTHGGVLYALMCEGKSIAEFCKFINIGERTFYKWVNKYPEFADHYEAGKTAAKGWWEDLGRNGITKDHFNATAWSMTMRNRFGYTEHRRIPIIDFNVNKTLTDKIRILEAEVSKGSLTGSEINYMSKFIETGIKVLQFAKMEQDIVEIKKALGLK